MNFHFEFTDEEVKQLRYERYHHPHPLVQRKMEALLLKSKNLAHKQIGDLVGVSQLTLRNYFRQYQSGGVEELKKLNYYQPKSKLEQHRSTIEEEFTKNPPVTLKEAAAKIKELTGIERSTVQVSKFLKKTGLRVGKQHPSLQKPTRKNSVYMWVKS